jgi:hypothetical protein
MKHCYVRFNEDFDVLYDNRYIRLSLFKFTESFGGAQCCHLSGPDDWEVSYTGYMADLKFEELLTLEEVSWADIERLGFTQYG